MICSFFFSFFLFSFSLLTFLFVCCKAELFSILILLLDTENRFAALSKSMLYSCKMARKKEHEILLLPFSLLACLSVSCILIFSISGGSVTYRCLIRSEWILTKIPGRGRGWFCLLSRG